VLAALPPVPTTPTTPVTPPRPATPTTPTQPKPPVVVQPTTPPVPVLTPAQQAQAAATGARTEAGLVYLPLTPAAGALGLSIRVLTPRTATLAANAADAGQVVPVRMFGKVAYVPLATLAKLSATQVTLTRTPTPAVTFTRPGRVTAFPLNLPKITPLKPQPEYPDVIVRK
jgi:hypothetical protein